MTLRTQLLLAQAPLALALVLVAVIAGGHDAGPWGAPGSASSRTTTGACSPRSG